MHLEQLIIVIIRRFDSYYSIWGKLNRILCQIDQYLLKTDLVTPEFLWQLHLVFWVKSELIIGNG